MTFPLKVTVAGMEAGIIDCTQMNALNGLHSMDFARRRIKNRSSYAHRA
jgi:hypothetical protein